MNGLKAQLLGSTKDPEEVAGHEYKMRSMGETWCLSH